MYMTIINLLNIMFMRCEKSAIFFSKQTRKIEKKTFTEINEKAINGLYLISLWIIKKMHPHITIDNLVILVIRYIVDKNLKAVELILLSTVARKIN